jgi:hypothetical protein
VRLHRRDVGQSKMQLKANAARACEMKCCIRYSRALIVCHLHVSTGRLDVASVNEARIAHTSLHFCCSD